MNVDEQKLQKRKRAIVRYSTMSASVLRGLALLGEIVYQSRNPLKFLDMLGLQGIEAHQRSWGRIARSLAHLEKKHYITIRDKNGNKLITLTKTGKTYADWLNLDNVKLQSSGPWDRTWHMVLFDVPNSKSSNRIAFGHKLKSLGFRMIQKSAWIYPYPCEKEIEQLKKFYEVEDYVAYLEIKKISGAIALQKRFRLTL